MDTFMVGEPGHERYPREYLASPCVAYRLCCSMGFPSFSDLFLSRGSNL